MKKLFVLVMIFTMVSVSAVYAKTVTEDCGCGLGSVLIGEKEGLLWNLLGTSLNGTSGNQTFGMTSGTSNCGKTEKLVKLEKMDKFVADNMDSLAVDMAKGEGESLDAVAELANVPSAKKAAFYSALQSNFNNIYTDTNVSHDDVVRKISRIAETI